MMTVSDIALLLSGALGGGLSTMAVTLLNKRLRSADQDADRWDARRDKFNENLSAEVERLSAKIAKMEPVYLTVVTLRFVMGFLLDDMKAKDPKNPMLDRVLSMLGDIEFNLVSGASGGETASDQQRAVSEEAKE